MDIELHLAVWNEVKEHILGSDRTDAAEDFVRVLIEHGADADKIAEYAIDDAVKSALKEYTTIEDDEDEGYTSDLDEYEYD